MDEIKLNDITKKEAFFDWSRLDVKKDNVFLLFAFNPLSDIETNNHMFEVKTPGWRDPKKNLPISTENEKKTLQHHLLLEYRNAQNIARFINFIKYHVEDIKSGGKTILFLLTSICLFIEHPYHFSQFTCVSLYYGKPHKVIYFQNFYQ